MAASSKGKTAMIRRVVHFSGFEPLDYAAHFNRYKRAVSLSGRVFGFQSKVSKTSFIGSQEALEIPQFSVLANGPDWQVDCHMTILEHNKLIQQYFDLPFWHKILRGYYAALMVVVYGGLYHYLRTAWRFACFFLFPFLFMGTGFLATLALAALPYSLGFQVFHIFWSAPLATMFFVKLFLPFAARFHVMLLFANCTMAIELVARKSSMLEQIQEHFVKSLQFVLNQPADEYVVSSHSMGGSLMIDALGSVLLANPAALDGKRVVICSMGGAGFQCTLMRPAENLRQKALLILNNPNVFWLDVQCLADFVSFYKVSFSTAFRMKLVKDQNIIFIRMKQMVSGKAYLRLKRDPLRLHRQYMMGSDQRSKFDYALLTAGPFPAAQFAAFSNNQLPPLGPDGALIG